VVTRPIQVSRAVAGFADKGKFRHFMEKEIHEQPDAVARTLSRYLDVDAGRFRTEGLLDWSSVNRVLATACGTAYYASSIAKFWFERYARLPMEADVASEFRYRDPVIGEADAGLFVSQSGETADTLAALRFCQQAGARALAIVNVPESSIAREADAVALTEAGPEIGVASTKAFTAQLAALACLAVGAGLARGHIGADEQAEYAKGLIEAPRLINAAIETEASIEAIAHQLTSVRDVLYLGRGVFHPLAMEGALKLKEISYIHAEGYPAGELKHGPIALIEDGTPVITVAPYDNLFEKTLSNIQEVKARGARVFLITDEAGAKAAGSLLEEMILLPDCHPLVQPIIASIPLQLLAYHVASLKGTDVDQPRNLAKSVTVE
jgi:glucosamine--fructose-6-phosphate aminotransferase (isomerizing)